MLFRGLGACKDVTKKPAITHERVRDFHIIIVSTSELNAGLSDFEYR